MTDRLKAKPLPRADVSDLATTLKAIPRAAVPIGIESRGVARTNPDPAPKATERPTKRRDELLAAYQDGPWSKPVPAAPGIQTSPLPRPKSNYRGGEKKGAALLMAEQITEVGQWFEWTNPPKTARYSVNKWAKAGLPVKAFISEDGRVIVCHKDAEVGR